MDTEPKNSKDPIGCLNSTVGIIGAIAALVGAMAGLLVALGGSGDPSGGTTAFSAVSHCSARNVNGYGEGSTERLARSIAIGECVSNGGKPDCCATDVRVY